jgi:hypothetical protein
MAGKMSDLQKAKSSQVKWTTLGQGELTIAGCASKSGQETAKSPVLSEGMDGTASKGLATPT